MNFSNILANASLFVDANTLVYYFTPDPVFGPICQQLLARIARGEIKAFTSTHVLSDLAHRMMTVEAIIRFGWPQSGIANRLRRHPSEVQTLTRFRNAIDTVPNFGIYVLPVHSRHVSAAGLISQQTGLLSGDALIVALMQDHGLTNIASNDSDFDRVPGLTRFAAL